MRTEYASLRGTAFHEAGHSVIGLVLGFELDYVTIGPDSKGVLGMSWFAEVDFFNESTGAPVASPTTFERAIKKTLAGVLSQTRAASVKSDVHGSADRQHVEMLLVGIPGLRAEKETRLASLTAETETLVAVCWPGIETLATLLLERSRLSGTEVEAELSTFLQSARKTISSGSTEGAGTP